MIAPIARALLRSGGMLDAALRAQARWDLQASRVILTRRKKLLLAALLPVLLLMAGEVAVAASLPETIGGRKAYMPALVTPTMFLGSVVTGLLAGLITGVIGAGGGYILTPALMSFGVKGIMAVGTDQFHLFAKAIMGTTIHRKLGHVNFWLAVWFVVGSTAGVTAGGYINRNIYNANPSLSDMFINTMYVVILGVLGVYALADWFGRRRSGPDDSTESIGRFSRRLQAFRARPRVRFDHDAPGGPRSISVYPVIACGLIVGVVASIMGVGGGFLTFPMFVYGLGVSTFTTVGTDILQIIFTTAYSSITQYAVYGYVFYTVAMGMLLGSLIGVQVGAMVTTVVRGSVIRAFYAITILAGFVNRLAAMPRKLGETGILPVSPSAGRAIEFIGVIVFFALVGLFGAWVVFSFCRHLPALAGRGSSPPSTAPTETGVSADERS